MFRLETFRKSYGLADYSRRLNRAQQQKDEKEGIVGGTTITGGTSGGY